MIQREGVKSVCMYIIYARGDFLKANSKFFRKLVNFDQGGFRSLPI